MLLVVFNFFNVSIFYFSLYIYFTMVKLAISHLSWLLSSQKFWRREALEFHSQVFVFRPTYLLYDLYLICSHLPSLPNRSALLPDAENFTFWSCLDFLPITCLEFLSKSCSVCLNPFVVLTNFFTFVCWCLCELMLGMYDPGCYPVSSCFPEL